MQFNQTLTYWALEDTDAYGNGTFAAPATKPCRWEGKSRLIVGKNQESLPSQATIYTEFALEAGSYVSLEATTETNPISLPQAQRILTTEFVENLKGTRTVFKSYV